VWFVDLSPLSGGDFLWDQLAMTLAVKEPGPGMTQQEAVGRYLAQRQVRVVLDNCEQVVESAAEVTASLLTAAPAVKVVASREALAVGGEVTWSVPPLSEPDAVQLFKDRARQVRPEMAFEADDEGAVLAICRSSTACRSPSSSPPPERVHSRRLRSPPT
jgi:predicted ATPase